jgi:hypothetical protein
MKISTLARVDVLKSQEAQVSREQLQQLRHTLVNPQSGHVASGYLRLSAAGSLNVGQWMTKGSKADAIASIKTLVHAAYGERLAQTGQSQKVDDAIDTYLRGSGQAFGSKSFVKLIDSLEAGLYPDDAQAANLPASAHATSGRLALSAAKFLVSSAEIEARASQSPIGAAAIDQFKALSPHMERNTMAHFSQLMFPPRSALNPVSAIQALAEHQPRTFAMGDADGSMGRMLLHVIASGTGQLKADKMPLLAKVLDAEFKCGELLDFQSNAELVDAHAQLAEALKVTPQIGHDEPACLFLGDILSDRFTNNQQAMSTMIFKLKGYDPLDLQKPRVETGVHFIAGNHDTVVIPQNTGAPPDSSWGQGAALRLTEPEHRTLLRKCFDAAVYAGGVLSTHQGVAASLKPGYYQTGLNVTLHRQQKDEHLSQQGVPLADGSKVQDSLRIQADNPKELAERINKMFHAALHFAPDITELVATNFRPQDKSMTLDAMWFPKDFHQDFRQIHGHNGDANEVEPGVTNLNPRNGGGDFAPASTVIEYPAKLSDSLLAAIPFV